MEHNNQYSISTLDIKSNQVWQSPELYRHRWVCQFSFARESNWVQMKKAKQTLNAADFLGKSKILFGKKKQRAHPGSLFGLCALCSCRTKCWCGLALTPLYCFLTISCVSGLVTYQLYSTWKHGYGMRKTPKICIPSILQHSTLVFLSCVEADLWDLVQKSKVTWIKENLLESTAFRDNIWKSGPQKLD